MSQILRLTSGTDVLATATGATSKAISLPDVATFELNVTSAGSEVTDTLDVFIQTRVVSSFVDVAHFTQVLGNGGAVSELMKIQLDVAEVAFDPAATLAAAAVLNVLGTDFRARWDIVDGSTPQAVTFAFDPVPANNIFTDVTHGFVADDRVTLAGTAVPAGYSTAISYYVIEIDADNFSLALTSGGDPVIGTDAGTSVTAQFSSVFDFSVQAQLGIRNQDGSGN